MFEMFEMFEKLLDLEPVERECLKGLKGFGPIILEIANLTLFSVKLCDFSVQLCVIIF